MKTIGKIVMLAAMILLNPLTGFGEVNLKKADKFFDNLQYEEAIPEYKKVLKEDNNNSIAISRLAHCYRLLKNKVEAERWYAAAVKLKDAKSIDYYYFSESLIDNGKYKEADTWIKKYIAIHGQDERSKKTLLLLQKINQLIEDSLSYNVENLALNSNQSDFGPVIYNGGIVFASAREKIKTKGRSGLNSETPFYSLYFSKKEGESYKKPETFAPSVLSQYNNGPICFNKDYNELYVTRNDIERNKLQNGEEGDINLKIYKFKKTKQDWTNETPFPFNSDEYNCAHAFLSADGNRFYFSSDMPGGYGKTDIYVSVKKGNKWGKPENLGPEINTRGSEGYPFLDNKDGLFFASNGHGGLGGFEILYSKKIEKSYATPINPGYPINTSSDDFGWVQDSLCIMGYFTSNRGGNDLNDDIYSFKRMNEMLNVRVYNTDENPSLAHSTIRIIESGKIKKTVKASKEGIITVYMEPGKTYQLVVEKDNFISEPIHLTNNNEPGITFREIPVTKNMLKQNTNRNNNEFLASNSNTHTKETYTPTQTRRYSSDPDARDTQDADNETTAMTDVDKEVETLDEEEMESIKAASVVQKKAAPVSANINTAKIQSSHARSPSHNGKPENKAYAMGNKKANTTGDDLYNHTAQIKLKNIYYELGKSIFQAEGRKELDIAAEILKSNPDMKIELRSHTDCRETELFNQKLSERRADEVVAYLFRKGVRFTQIIAKGYGETRLVNHCECEGNRIVPCSEQEHQANRRTELRLLTFRSQ